MMHSLFKPDQCFEDVFMACIDNCQESVKEKLLEMKDSIRDAISIYDHQMNARKGHEIKTIIESDSLMHNELKKLYSNKMVQGKARSIYDKILVQSKRKGCCFCSYAEPTQLDHFLPKSKFSEFSIAPINLIPVCASCNTNKGSYCPQSALDSFIHPYYYEVDIHKNVQWLEASIVFQDNAPSVIYSIIDDIVPCQRQKLNFQFKRLKLNKRYSFQAARELANRQQALKNAYKRDSIKEVKFSLQEEYKSRAMSNKNSWDTALYKALLENDQFCEMEWDI